MLRLFNNFKKSQVFMIFFCIVFIVLQVWLDLKIPDYMSTITKLVQTEGSTVNEILVPGAYMLACALGSLVFSVIVGFLASYIAASFSMNIREKLFKKVESLGMHEIKKFSTSSLITRTTNDITQIQMLISMGLQVAVKAPITAVWAIIKILDKSFEWTLVVGGGVVILLITIAAIFTLVIPRFSKVQKLIDKVNALTRENLTGIRVVRAFNAEKYQEDKFEETNEQLTNTQIFNQRTFGIMQPMMYLIMNVSTLIIYFMGAFMIDKAGVGDKISIFGDMVVFSSYGMQVIMSFLMLAMILIMYPRAAVSARRINEVLDEKVEIVDGSYVPDENESQKGTVEFKDVSFKYPDGDEYVLENISFKADRGETVAFIGATGCGKTTLVNLIPRFYDATSGEVLVNGVNVKAYKEEALNNKLGYVPQKAVMFGGTVFENVSYGENDKVEMDESRVKKAIEVAQAKEFVEKMEDNYYAHIAQGGTNVSGGQKQRLSIARAVARDPEIYIFDDTFSALDYKTDSKLRKELREYTKNATTLIVSQRIGTIINANKILVLDKGKCVGMGTHKELLKTCKVYKEIALSQLSKEELENG